MRFKTKGVESWAVVQMVRAIQSKFRAPDMPPEIAVQGPSGAGGCGPKPVRFFGRRRVQLIQLISADQSTNQLRSVDQCPRIRRMCSLDRGPLPLQHVTRQLSAPPGLAHDLGALGTRAHKPPFRAPQPRTKTCPLSLRRLSRSPTTPLLPTSTYLS